jgi:hypothetical protein
VVHNDCGGVEVECLVDDDDDVLVRWWWMMHRVCFRISSSSAIQNMCSCSCSYSLSVVRALVDCVVLIIHHPSSIIIVLHELV